MTGEPVRKTQNLHNIANIITVEATIVGHEDAVVFSHLNLSG